MLKKLIPDFYYNNVFEINEEMLNKNGIKGILFDIDNTLTLTNIKGTDIKVKEFLFNLKEKGIKIFLITNAPRKRIDLFDLKDSYPYIYSALKPFKSSYKKALENLELKSKEVLMVGDQIFTDIYGGNRMGMKTVLVKPIKKYDENIFVKFKRIIEIWIVSKIKNEIR